MADNKNKSEEIHYKLVNLAIELDDISRANIEPGMSIDDVSEEVRKMRQEKEILPELYHELFELYRQCQKDNFFWKFAPLKIYKSHLNNRFEEYKTYFPDATLIDFLEEDERNLFYTYHDQDYIYDEKINSHDLVDIICIGYQYDVDFLDIHINLDGIYDANSTLAKAIEYTQQRKSEFIKATITKLKNADTIEETDISIEKEEELDYSDSKYPERFVMLHELGIIDYLKSKLPSNFSNVKLGALISSFTGDSAENIRSDITNVQNNNSKSKIKTHNLNKVDAKLLSLDLTRDLFKK